ncbi:MAG: hypothetical protein AB1502_04695 [Thermodesulfobacteriota bacterium]
MEKTLLKVGFLDANQPKRIMRVLRRLLGRSQMEEREVQIFQGICQIEGYLRRGGKKEDLKDGREKIRCSRNGWE